MFDAKFVPNVSTFADHDCDGKLAKNRRLPAAVPNRVLRHLLLRGFLWNHATGNLIRVRLLLPQRHDDAAQSCVVPSLAPNDALQVGCTLVEM